MIVASMKRVGPEQKNLTDETKKLRDQEQNSVGAVEGLYAAFKGSTGIAIDYKPPADEK